jgi:hypothetical protein
MEKEREERLKEAIIGLAKVALHLELTIKWKEYFTEKDLQRWQELIHSEKSLPEEVREGLAWLGALASEFFPDMSPTTVVEWVYDCVEMLRRIRVPPLGFETLAALLIFGGYLSPEEILESSCAGQSS